MENKDIEILKKKLSSYQRAKDYFTKTQKGELPKETEDMIQALTNAIDLAIRYQKVKGLPKETGEYYYDKALSACKLALVKMRPTVEELVKIINDTKYLSKEELTQALLKEWDRRFYGK